MSIWNSLKSELTSEQVVDVKESECTQKRENVYMFLRLPLALEKFMFFGFLQCADSFLYICSLLPLRILFALVQTFRNPFRIGVNCQTLFKPARLIDFSKLFLIITCYFSLTFIDTSMVYHLIRGQTIIKLYIFFNMLEVADRLLSSVGHDVCNALYFTITEPHKPKYLALPHLFLAFVYVFCHSIVFLCQTTTLNVAFNSHNKSLLSIMMSNNFVELKGSVFKKFDKNNLFQMSCSDVKERFVYMSLLLIILIRNMAEFDWQLEQLFELIPVFCTIFFSEFFIDWIKHAFVLKFNNISAEVFNEFKINLSYLLIEAKNKREQYDFQSNCYGFIPIPLFCLLLRICFQSIKFNNTIAYLNLLVVFTCLLLLKVLNNLILLGLSCKYLLEKRETKALLMNSSDPAEKKVEPIIITEPVEVETITPIEKQQHQPRSAKISTSGENEYLREITDEVVESSSLLYLKKRRQHLNSQSMATHTTLSHHTQHLLPTQAKYKKYILVTNTTSKLIMKRMKMKRKADRTTNKTSVVFE